MEELCAGSVAKVFEQLGGKVIYFGKPYEEVYKMCFSKNERVLAIGDNLRTDIKGANVLNFYYEKGKSRLGPRRYIYHNSFEVGKYYIINAKITLSSNNYILGLNRNSYMKDDIVAVYSWGSAPLYNLNGLFFCSLKYKY